MERPTLDQPGYGSVAKSLHWLIVALLIVQYTLGLVMPHVGRGTEPVGLIGLHVSFGALTMAVALVRLAWRQRRPVPLLAGNAPPWQQKAASATHILLYVLLFVVPILGWINGAARGWRPMLFWIVPLPQIVATRSPIGRQIGDYHNLSAWVLAGVIGLHLAATLYHQLVLRDRVLQRMLPST